MKRKEVRKRKVKMSKQLRRATADAKYWYAPFVLALEVPMTIWSLSISRIVVFPHFSVHPIALVGILCFWLFLIWLECKRILLSVLVRVLFAFYKGDNRQLLNVFEAPCSRK